MAENFEIECPHCRTTIVVEKESGNVLWHKPVETARKHDLDAMVSGLRDQKDDAAKRFERELASQKDRKRLLDEKFNEAMKRADKSPTPVKNPLDLD